MGEPARVRRMTRRFVSILATAGLLAAMLAVTTGQAAAHPSTPTTLTFHFTDCSGPAGTPKTFDAVKQPGGAAALHLLDASGVFIAVRAIDVESGTTLFATPGFEHNNLPTITCQLIHPVTSTRELVTGLMAPVG
jgi:hypothetical protein